MQTNRQTQEKNAPPVPSDAEIHALAPKRENTLPRARKAQTTSYQTSRRPSHTVWVHDFAQQLDVLLLSVHPLCQASGDVLPYCLVTCVVLLALRAKVLRGGKKEVGRLGMLHV